MTTLFVYAPALEHTYPRHPENSQRPQAIYQLLQHEKLLPNLLIVSPSSISERQLTDVHDPHLIDYVHEACLRGGGRLDADTYATAESYKLARLAAGTACKGVDHIMNGIADNGFVVVRPPGHHAEYKRVGGFCLFNNVAAAARHAQKAHGLKRVMIIDFDVHHGNGTQDIFYDDEAILFVSLHQYGDYFYPGTGGILEIGKGAGRGYTLNVPLPPLVGDQGYKRIFEEVIFPKAREFQPELLLISAGYDAHWADPLASAALSLRGYGEMAQGLVALADELCSGRVLFVLEGGYLLEALSYGVLNTIFALLKRDEILDSLGSSDQPEADINDLLDTLHKIHLIK